MLKFPAVAFNIDLLQIPESVKKTVRPVTSLDIYSGSNEGASANFHPDGLYSTEIFGVMGTKQRMERYSWIDLKIQIFHPTFFYAVCKLKSLYGDILAGREFATFDAATRDFVKTDALTGETGYEFFMRHWKKIDFKRTSSSKRDEIITFVDKYKNNATLDSLYVLPAGYRDIQIEADGRESSDEVNKLYYKVIAVSNTLNAGVMHASPEMYNAQRISLQNAVNEIYLMMIKIIKGKHGLMMSKYMARNIFDSTRNVITAMPLATTVMGAPGNPTINDTMVGLYQYVKSTLRPSIYQMRTGFLSKCFLAPSAPAVLTNKKTLRAERVQITNALFDRWATVEGLQKVVNIFEEPTLRGKPIDVGGYYLGLMYRGPDNTFKMINGIDELPEGRSKEHCLPITLIDLFYASTYLKSRDYVSHVTRYPVGSDGSNYPSDILLMSTVKSEVRIPLDDDWRPYTPEYTAYRFPVPGSDTFNSQAPHPSRHKKLNADHDGDTCSFLVAYSTEAREEFHKRKRMAAFYLSVNGGFMHNLANDTINYVTTALTGG